jgi:L-talarate/galactarate dehydratase
MPTPPALTHASQATALPDSAADSISWVKISRAILPLPQPISDAKVLTGRQKPMTEISILFAEIATRAGHTGLGFSYSKRAGGAGQYAHAVEIAPELIGEDANDIQRIWTRLVWAGASVGRSGMSTQAIAAIDIALWDLKARRAGLPLAKLLGAHRDSVRCYNTSGGFLHTPIEQLLDNATASLDAGIGGIKIKVGHPDSRVDIERVAALRKHVGDRVPIMVDANQQWDRATAATVGRALGEFELTWIEEPLDAYDSEGHAALVQRLDTPIASGEMLTSVAEHEDLIRHRAVDILQPDCPRIGGITPFLKLMALADQQHLQLAPHFAMELHVHLAAAYPHEPWVEHFEWLEPLFTERILIKDGRMAVPDRPGLGISLSDAARAWTTLEQEFGARPADQRDASRHMPLRE